MKYISIIIVMLLLFSSAVAEEQKQSKKEQRIAKREKEKQQNQILHNKAVKALDSQKWAFEADEFYNQKGELLKGEFRPNVIGSSGKRLVAYLAYTHEDAIYRVTKDGPIREIKKSTTKKGKIVYKIRVDHPFPAEVIIVVNKDSNFATLTLHEGTTKTVNHSYKGHILPATDSRHYYMIKVE